MFLLADYSVFANRLYLKSAAMVLAKALVEREKEMESSYDPKIGHVLPEIPLHEARQIMTRADFIQSYDQINVFTINSEAMVRAGEYLSVCIAFLSLRPLIATI